MELKFELKLNSPIKDIRHLRRGRSHAVLQTSLPQKEEYVLLVRMTPFQRKLYDTFMNDVVRTKAVPNPLKAFAVCCKIWNHPDVLFHFLRKREAAAVDIDLDLDETTTETSSVAGSSRTSVSPAAPKKGRGRNAPKGTKKEKKGKANTSQVQPFANSNTNVGSKPAATITPNSSNVVSENSNTSMEIEQPVVNPPILTSSPKHMEPTDNNQQYTPQGIPESQPLQTDYSQPPVTDFNYHNNQSYQQPYSQNYYPPTNIKDDYRNNQYSVNPNQQYSDAYAPYSQNMNYGGQQNYWNHNNYYPSMEYNNWNPEYGNNMYGNPNQYDNRFPYMDNIKQEDKTWNTLEHENQYNPEKVQVKQEVDHSKFGDVKLEPLEDETILELKPIIPKEKQEPVVADQLKTEEKEMGIPEDMNKDKIIEEMDAQSIKLPKEEGIPYDWAIELLKGYAAGVIENSAKMEIFFCILEESIKLGDRILVFSQSLFTLNLIEDFLHKNNVPGTENKWAKNVNYYRLDGSTSALEREKLINEFNSNPNIHIFLVSTRAGSLGINLVGANRVIVFDASWNPCHDTQAVCRVYRYGQKKPCFVYRLVMDNSLEKKIYDRQINKQGMADRVVDECNPDAHLSLKEVTNLCWDDEQDAAVSDFSHAKDKYIDVVMQKVVEAHSHTLSKEPFQHESLLIDRKEKKLSQAEKRLAQRGYELEKQAATRPTYSYSSGTGLQYRTVRTPDGAIVHRPVASVRPMQADNGERSGTSRPGGARPTRWIPAEVWQRQGMTAQEMTLPLDVVIPTSSVEKSNIVLKAGQKVMVLKSPKGIYMQLESGKIIAIRTAFKVGQGNKSGSTDAAAKDGPPGAVKKGVVRTGVSKISPAPNLPGNLKHNTSITVIPTKQSINLKGGVTAKGSAVPILNRKDNIKLSLQGKAGVSRNVGADKQLGTARPYNLNRGKLQVKSITKSIGNILNVSKPKEVPPPVDSEQETSNAGSSSSKDGDSSNSIKIDDGEMEQGEKCNALENSDSQANPVDITIPSMSQLASTPEDDIIATETSHSSASEESASINMKCEESSHTLDLDSVSTIEGTLNESSNMDAYPVENANANVSDDLAIKRPTSVVNVVDDTMSMQSSTNMPVESAPVLPREKVVYRPNLVERRPKPATTSLQRTSLKNYRHKSSHKQTLVSNTSVNSPMSSGVHLGESSLSQLEKSTTALSNESNNRFQSSLTNITSSYTPTMETLKRDSVKDTHGNSKKMKYNNSDTESTLEDKSGTSSGSLTAKRSTVTNLDEKPMDRYAIENTTPQLEEGKNVINLDDKNDSSLNNFTSNEFTIANNYPKHTSHTMVNPQRLQETNNESLQQQFTDCTNNTESNVIPPSNISQHPLHVQQTPILPQPPQSQLNMHSHPQLSQSPHPQIPNSQTLHPQIQQSQSQSPQVQPPQGQQPVQAHPPQAQPPHGQIQPPHLQLSHPQPPHPHPSQPPHPQPPHSQHYPPYAGGYSYPSNWGAPPSESTMYPNYDPSYSPLFHGHSAFHRPEPLPVPVPGADVNQPGSYPIHPYPPHPTTPSSQPSTYTGNQNTSAPNMTTGAPPAPNSHQSYGPPQNYPPQNYPGQNPVPNYPIPGQNLNPYPGFAGQPIPPYGQFGGNFSPAPMNQAPYNTRPMYPTPDYTGSGYGTSGAYAPYPPQTTNQWGQ